MAWTINQTGEGNLVSIREGFRALAGSEVKYGWTEDSADYPNGDSVVEIAAFHQFGTSTIPARPILTETFERNVEQLGVLSEAINDEIIDTQTDDLEPALRVIGQFAQSEMQRDFTRAQGELEPLKEATIRSKGHDLRLIETGHLRAQVKFKVVT